MKNLIFLSIIIIILFKTGNVLSNNNIFNVNNIEISNEFSKNKQKIVNQSFRKAYDELIKRLLLEDDYNKHANLNLDQIKDLISYYQIITPNSENNENKNIIVNVFFNKKEIHKFFYKKNLLYSDIINTEVILFPLLKKNEKFFIYTQNYFYENWNVESNDGLIQYALPVENIENIQKINLNKDKIYKIDIGNFFNEYPSNNIVFANIELNKNKADIFLNTRIEGKKINKTLNLNNKKNLNQVEFNKEIITKINQTIKDLIKSQNLIDVRTPSFLNVKIKQNNKNNLARFSSKVKNIDLIDNFYVQQLNKDFVIVKIKYLGKIDKIIKKLKYEKIFLKMSEGQWQLSLT